MTPNATTDSATNPSDSQPTSALSTSSSTASHNHNPFHIGSLPDLSLSRSRSSSSRRSESQERAKQEKSEEKEKRRSKRRSLINAGRSLSPFRHHSRNSSSNLRSKRDAAAAEGEEKGVDEEGEKKSVKPLDESDSEKDSRKWSSRLCPRNNAFNPLDPEDEEDFVPRARPVRKGTGWNSSNSVGSKKEGQKGIGKEAAAAAAARGSNDASSIATSTTSTTNSSLDIPKESSDSISRPSIDSVRSVDTYDSSILSTESDKEKEADNSKDTNRDSDEDSESTSSELSFDPELLDNTLFNAGCLDLHGAWQAGGTTSSRPASIVGTNEMERGDSHDSNSMNLPGTSAPSAYDSLWGPGAGATNDNLIRHEDEFGLGSDNLEAPNVVLPSAPLNAHSIGHTNARTFEELHEHSPVRTKSPNRTKSSTSSEEKSTAALQALSKENQPPQDPSHALTASRPFFERNRCTITLIHGEYEKKAEISKRPKRYIVASDGSEEASYAIEWCIGTVLRDGDETLIVSVMETDTKLDAIDPAHEDRTAKMEHQKVRQSMALVLARQATALLQRTRLGVKISCQALHSKNARHMLLDMIDFFAPTLVIVGSRGLSALKGILLGSTSHYLVQKSSVPVMVARKRLKLPALPRVRRDVVESVRARHMRLDEAAIEKESKVEEKVDEEGKTKADNEGEQSEEKSETEGKATSTSNPEDQTGVSEQEKKEEPKSPEQIAERASEETNPISPPLEDSNVKSSDAAAPLNHSIFPSLQTQGEDGTQTQLQPSQSNDSTTESVTHLAQDQESPQRGRSMKQTKE